MIPMKRPLVEEPQKPYIIGRDRWGAADPQTPGTRHQPLAIVVHHSWLPTAEDANKREPAEVVCGIQRYHMEAEGWADIGYHFVITPDGSIFEGRPVAVMGAHCGKKPPKGIAKNFDNRGTIGICCIGNYDIEEPGEPLLWSLDTLIRWLRAAHGIGIAQVFGHCQAWTVAPKTCPGHKLFVALFGADAWRAIRF